MKCYHIHVQSFVSFTYIYMHFFRFSGVNNRGEGQAGFDVSARSLFGRGEVLSGEANMGHQKTSLWHFRYIYIPYITALILIVFSPEGAVPLIFKGASGGQPIHGVSKNSVPLPPGKGATITTKAVIFPYIYNGFFPTHKIA